MKDCREKIYKYRMKYSDKCFDVCNTVIMSILLVVFAWPLWFIIIASFSDPSLVMSGKVLIWPKGFNFDAYKRILEMDYIWKSYLMTIFYTVAGTVINIVLTICAAFPLSRSNFAARKVILYMLLFTMYFSGGLIPTYLIVKKLGLIDTIWAMILPSACSVYNVLIVRTYFRTSIPSALEDAAVIDGANEYQYLMKIVLPLSKPVISVITLYYMVGHWNDYYTGLIYIIDSNLKPLQCILRDLLLSAEILRRSQDIMNLDQSSLKKLNDLALSLRYSTIVASSVPVIAAYFVVQKHFEKGIMIGSVKE